MLFKDPVYDVSRVDASRTTINSITNEIVHGESFFTVKVNFFIVVILFSYCIRQSYLLCKYSGIFHERNSLAFRLTQIPLLYIDTQILIY